jgi:hypothetical protein
MSIKTIKTHTTSKGNELEFYTISYCPKSIFVLDKSCQLERRYIIGRNQLLCWDDYDKSIGDYTTIVSFDQVIDAWVNEKIHF